MPDFDINSVLSQFGAEAPKSKVSTFDIDSILNKFGSTDEPVKADTPAKVIIRTPKPPISGISREASDEINQAEPSKSLPASDPPLTSKSAYEQNKSGKEMFSSGIEDITSGHPYKGVGKAALGALQVVGAPLSGIIDDTVGAVGNKIGPDFGDKAALLVGSALPVVPGAGAVIKAIPKNKALSTLVESIGAENLPAVVSQMKANPRLAPADLSPKVLQDTQHLFANDGPQINYLKNTSDARMAGAKEAVETAYDKTTGLPVNAVTKLKALEDAAKKVGSTEINPAITGAKPVDVTPVVDHIDGMLKPGVMSKVSNETLLTDPDIKRKLAAVKQYLTDSKSMRTDANDLHTIQSSIRGAAQNLLSSASGADRQAGYALMQVRNKLVDAIDKASDGKYKPALAKYKDEKDINDAFNYGYESVFTNSKKLESRPEFTEQWVKSLTKEELEAAKEGARLQLDTQIHNFRFAARKGQEIPEADFNKAKLELLFGKEQTDTLVKALKDERTIANTHNKVIEGSQTAMRTASKDQFALPSATDVMKSGPAVAAAEASSYFMGGAPGMGAAALTGAKVIGMGKDAIRMKLAREHNAQYAKYALPTEGPSRDALIKSLEARIPGPKQSLLTRGANSLSRLVAP